MRQLKKSLSCLRGPRGLDWSGLPSGLSFNLEERSLFLLKDIVTEEQEEAKEDDGQVQQDHQHGAHS